MNDNETIKEQIRILCEEFGIKLIEGDIVFPNYLKEEVEASETFKLPVHTTLQ